MNDARYVCDIHTIDKNDISMAGGKGASLGEMTRAGISVPPGFVILANAFEKFLEETDLNVEIDSILHSVNHKEIHTIKNASEKIKALILGAEMPMDIAYEIRKFFKKLGSKYAAVRSSATAEDSASAAWAGQLESYLNTTEKTLLENVKKCWASLFTPRAIFYRFEKKLHKQKISVAVVVQKMVESEKSGIAFSVHPVTEDRNQLIIEAGLGLGEAIVSGQITPDSYVVEKQPRKIIDTNVEKQAQALFRSASGGNEWREVPKEQGEKQVLSDGEILELSEIILRIESHYGFPCDIEWAFKQGKFYILQSRPITSLSSTAEKKVKWKKLAEREADFWKNYIMISSLGNIKKVFGCDINEWLTTRTGMTFTHWASPEAIWNCSLQIEKKLKKRGFIEKIKKVFETSRKKLLALNKYLEKANYGKFSNRQLFELFKKFCKAYGNLYAAFQLSVHIDSIEHKARNWLLNKLKETGSEKMFDDCFVKLAFWPNPSLIQQEKLALSVIALKVKENKIKRNNLDKALSRHTEKFAGLPVINDMVKPWTQEYFIEQLNELLSQKKDQIFGEVKKLRSYSKQTVKEQAELFKKLSAQQLFQDFFKLIGLMTWVRLTGRNTFAMSHYSSRHLFGEIGQRRGLATEDVKWLTSDEIGKLILTGQLPAENKLKSRKIASVLLFHNGKYKVAEGEKADQLIKSEIGENVSFAVKGSIKGAVAYPGFARGKVKLIFSHGDIPKMKKGDILVSRMTTVEITPAIRLAAGIITDEGGITCHAAIISRELKIPCVVGTKHATKIFNNNDFVEMDANKGLVNLIKKYV